MSLKEKFNNLGNTIDTCLQAISFHNNFYYVNFVDFETEEVFCFQGGNENDMDKFFTFSFAELEEDENIKLYTYKEI